MTMQDWCEEIHRDKSSPDHDQESGPWIVRNRFNGSKIKISTLLVTSLVMNIVDHSWDIKLSHLPPAEHPELSPVLPSIQAAVVPRVSVA